MQPKFTVGDLVDVRSEHLNCSGMSITHVEHHEGALGEDPEGVRRWFHSGFYYGVSGYDELWNHEEYIFPHNKPADAPFHEIMEFVKQVNTDGEVGA